MTRARASRIDVTVEPGPGEPPETPRLWVSAYLDDDCDRGSQTDADCLLSQIGYAVTAWVALSAEGREELDRARKMRFNSFSLLELEPFCREGAGGWPPALLAELTAAGVTDLAVREFDADTTAWGCGDSLLDPDLAEELAPEFDRDDADV